MDPFRIGLAPIMTESWEYITKWEIFISTWLLMHANF